MKNELSQKKVTLLKDYADFKQVLSPKHHFTTTSKTSRYFQNVAVLANYMQREGCIPFEVTTKTKPNTETVAALLEARTLMNNPQSKTYSIEEALKELKK